VKFIVTTTINEPTEALRKFAQMPDWKLVVVGDRKTPHESYTGLDGVTYLLPGYQENLDSKLSAMLGWNCIQRRNMGFLYAMQNGAELVATVDDDNIPQLGWGDSLLGREVLVNSYQSRTPAFDPLSHTNGKIWHRGFPWQWVANRAADMVTTRDRFDVQANLWNGAPDIDAICRAVYPQDVRFGHVDPFTATRPMPFNSQNTILTRKAMKDYFCFPGLGRYDDIYASYVCQAYGNKVVFGGATVFQKRNPHDITADFNAEVYGYQNCAKFITDLADNREAWKALPSQAMESFERYRELVGSTS
jgi:hypothetical protein